MNEFNQNVKSFFNIVLLVLFLQFLVQESSAQCTIGDSIGEYDATSLPIGVRTKINDTISAGEYITLQNIVAEFTYTLDVCSDGANTNLTLFDNTKSSIDFDDNGCGNDGKITFIAPSSGVYFIQLNLASCGTDAVAHELFLEKDTSYCPLGVANSTYNTTPLAADNRTLISSTVKAGQYVTLNNIIANTTYVVDACSDPANTSLTLRNTSGESIKFSSNGCGDDGKITFTAPTSGAYQVSLNIDVCGTDAVNHSIYITKSSCNNPDSANITVTQAASCYGDTEILTFGGNLNDGTYWIVYKDTVGGEIIDTAFTNSFTFIPLQGTRKYFIRGEGGCVLAADAYYESISITTNFKDPTFSYNSPSYCIQDTDTIPQITGETGGTFTSSPSGLSINSTTGKIDNSASTPGTYTITYTTPGPCAAIGTFDVSITSLDNVTYSYGSTSFCKSDGDPIPTVSGVPGGVFSSSSTNFIVNPSNGIIDISASTAGTYTVTYTTSGNCANSGATAITINNADNGAFSYASASYCPNGTDPAPTITGLTGGNFSSTSGLTINTTSGLIDLGASSPNNYNVFYTTNGSCPVTTNFSLNLNAMDNANYDFGKTLFCETESSQLPTVFSSGGFTFTPAGLSINTTSGLLNPSASTNGNYSLTYTSTGSCPSTVVKTITISAMDNANFTYPNSNYCLSAVDPTPTITGLTGGSFSSVPFGLSVNGSTGEIDLSASVPTNYLINYTTTGNCPSTVTVPLAVNNLDNAEFNYSKNNYCITSSDPTPDVTGIGGGVFSSLPAGLSINATSGLIDIGSSAINTYNVTYTTSGNCPNSSTQSIILSSLDDASFDYVSPTYCAFSTDALPTITGLTTGAFSASPSGLSMQQNNGYINTGSSNPGTYTITYTTAGDCMNSSSDVVTVIAADDASFNYDAVEYCEGGTDPSPTVTGLNGGTYSSSPSGLSINSANGDIDLSTSSVEVYSVEYTTNGTCPNTSTQVVILLGSSDAGFSYSSSNYCTSGSDPSPLITGLTGGTFGSVPSGLSLDPFTGVIDLSTSLIGSYSVTYSVGGDCPSSQTQIVNIDNLDDASFNYSATNFCTSGSDPLPTIIGLAGGTFSSSPAGLVLYTASGEVDLDASPINDYSITYTTAGACPNSSSQNFFLRNFDDASFSFAQNTYCITALDPSPAITGLAGGSFSSTPAGLTINLLSGKIDLSASAPGIYDVTYTTTGDCPNTNTQTITVSALDDPSFNYPNLSYCVSDADPTPTITGVLGGSFSSLPSGLDLDVSSGLITLSSSSSSTYAVTYTTNGNCPSSSTQNVVVNEMDNSNFNYGQPSFCVSSANPFPSILGDFGGTFTSSPSGLTIDSGTGEVDINTSTLNSYTITYTTAGSCPTSSNQNLVLNSFDDASFNYDASSYCTTNTNPSPTITGVTGGTFSYSPSGLSFSAIDGTIDLSNCIFGTYTITYATSGSCQNSSSETITITDVDDASFTYGANNFCVNDTDPAATILGVSGGDFSSSPSGLNIDPATGFVDIQNSIVGDYLVQYTTATSCPTTYDVSFEINDVPIVSQVLNECDSALLNGNVYYTSQLVEDTLSGLFCDSIVNTDLFVNSSNVGTDAITAWCSHIWLDGVEYFDNNTSATHTLINQFGCDSLVTLDLVISSVDTSVNIYNSTFVSNASNATYQWVNCTQNYSAIPNATNKTFMPTQNGNYAVIVTENACTDTSACFFLTNVGVNSEMNNFGISVFPNPVEDVLNIELAAPAYLSIIVTNVEGKVVTKEMSNETIMTQISLAKLESGIYFVTLSSEFYQTTVKLIKL